MLVGLTIVCVITWLVSGFASADEIQTVATKLMERVAQYSIRHPDQPGSRTEWIDGWAGTPFLIRTCPEATHAYYVVPVFNSSDKITSLIGIDAETSEWQWYTRQYTYDTFPPVCRADALAAMEHFLQKRGITTQLSPPILISTPDMRMYWWSVVYPPGEGVREVFVCSNNSQRVYTDLERKEALNKKGDPQGSSASYKPKRSKLIHHNLPDAHDITDLPYHSQETDWYCGEAALQMIFDYYGPLISQDDIGDVADESAGSGTYPDNLRRAAHFSSWSTAVQNPDLRGYAERDLGYGAFEYEWSYSSQYPNRYTDLKHLVSQDFPVLILAQNHYLVVKGYNDSLDVFMVHDPWPSYGPDVSVRQSFLVDHRWVGSDRWGLFVSPWSVDVDAPDLVVQDGKFTVDVTVTYVAPPPFGDEYYPLSVPLASIILPSRFTLAGGIPTKGLPSLLVPGASEKVSWRVKALDRVSPRDTIAVSVRGFIRGRSRSYFLLYQDWIGGVGWDTLATATNVFLCDDYLIDDDTEGESWGNGDGVIDAGEVIELSVRVRYIGDIPATQVYGLLSISRANPHIELLDSLAAFGDAFGDTTLMCRNSFRFAVSEWCSEDHLIEFTLEITDSAGNTWEESLEVFVNSATDIVCNGDFSSGDISCWSFYHTSYTPVPTWNVVDDPKMGQALKITRSDPEPWEWARSSLVQTLHDADLSDPLLLLSFDVKVSYQNPSCSEYWWYGFPASFFLRYEDTMGEYYDLRRSFYYFGWSPDPLAEKIAQDTWVHRVYDLTFLAPSAAEFTQIKLFCDGYGWDVSFDNVEILLAEPGRAKGDINGDRYVNVLDVVLAAKIVIGTYRPTAVEHWAADTTNDGRVDVADVVGIVNIIIGTSP